MVSATTLANAFVKIFGTVSDVSICVRGIIRNGIAAGMELVRTIRTYRKPLIATATDTKHRTKIPSLRRKLPRNAPTDNSL
jgi:hypothetical protein